MSRTGRTGRMSGAAEARTSTATAQRFLEAYRARNGCDPKRRMLGPQRESIEKTVERCRGTVPTDRIITDDDITKMQSLRRMGYSIADIADVLGLFMRRVRRLFELYGWPDASG